MKHLRLLWILALPMMLGTGCVEEEVTQPEDQLRGGLDLECVESDCPPMLLEGDFGYTCENVQGVCEWVEIEVEPESEPEPAPAPAPNPIIPQSPTEPLPGF